ncbi:PLK protein kinase [Magnaporthiopsis poae ATCC 64411]|uniref:PLK protein kinase n=1 Tax=Magnaporthiopsis poae (strain ATCC 64411 / 73-15) TaxID=644358 RepID=A0A0C4EAL0_MAGP6|nr:PLK protein kinase [Magnaporthiopsis poae ATCC 64411]
MVVKGVDMEALSPRDANAQRPQRANDIKNKATAQLKANKEKEHPPPPPPHVTEPPSAECRDGMVYQVGKLLGKGGFAVCYEGQPAGTRKRYALKIVKSEMPRKMEQKFQTELQIHSKMRHQNIVQFHRAFSFETSTYLVLELCPNGSLMDMVKRRKGVTEAEVRFYSVQIAGAIKYMHSKGIIHRDLKMGNIFLDKQMNAKIGDFGLAALLVTGRDMQTIRRTTLCGTPNYIAPEILEKGRKGHDHNVDIWSLGVIVFAMLTSKPPFQSTTTDEIYRRARDRDYEWPSRETSSKIISQEAKNLVADMLQEADRRPDPDQIVQHPFFRCGYMPLPEDMSPRLREYPPEQERFYNFPTTAAEEAENLRNLKEMCNACEVGPLCETQRVHRPIWKEMAGEEQAGLTPIIPLAEGIIYRPFEEAAKEGRLKQKFLPPPTSTSPPLDDISPLARNPITGATVARGGPPQSFAAQQRAQNKPGKAATAPVIMQEAQDAPARQSAAARSRAKREAEEAAAATATLTDRLGQMTLSRSQSARSVEAREQAGTVRTRPARTQLPTSRTEPSLRRAASNPTRPQTTVPRREGIATISGGALAAAAAKTTSIFSPSEPVETVPSMKPDVVLERLRKLQAELERALNSRTTAFVSTKEKPPATPQIVVKWVDYTNKFGLGYVLSDGGIGCILRQMPVDNGDRTEIIPPTCFLVHDGEYHYIHRRDPSYPDGLQAVPMTRSIPFYEHNGEQGFSTLNVSPESFRVEPTGDGEAPKMTYGKNIWEHRRRERIVLWKKFANYMLTYSRDFDPELPVPSRSAAAVGNASDDVKDVVMFYQRFGDVGCWLFGDGHIQFNFPDHTKIVVDATGTWCHFWHLTVEAARRLAGEGVLDETSLDERTVLSYPLQTLLNFNVSSAKTVRAGNPTWRRPEIAPEMRDIPAANDFRRKIEFMRSVVREWIAGGGVGSGDRSPQGRLRWKGHRMTERAQTSPGAPPGMQKHVWVTIGALHGDFRATAWFDPKNPNDIKPDVDESAIPRQSNRTA